MVIQDSMGWLELDGGSDVELLRFSSSSFLLIGLVIVQTFTTRYVYVLTMGGGPLVHPCYPVPIPMLYLIL